MNSNLDQIKNEQETNTRDNGLQRNAGVAEALIHDIDANGGKSGTANNVWF